jgi:hypothetical protein
MRYLAVGETARPGFWASLRPRVNDAPTWHAVTESSPPPVKTLCGIPYTSEALRTWDQTPVAERCPQCERMVTGASRARSAPFIADVVPAHPVKDQPKERRIPKGA